MWEEMTPPEETKKQKQKHFSNYDTLGSETNMFKWKVLIIFLFPLL